MSIPPILYIMSFEIAYHIIIGQIMVIDMMTTPLLIEVSYLACNKRNLDVLCSRGAFVEILRDVMKLKSNRRIEPVPVEPESSRF
ncbi:unnamed protein product [Caenorhabditis brenneri]